MTPMFDPGPNLSAIPPIFLAAVGPLMAEVAGEVGDGVLAHAFTTERYLREVTFPALERGLAASGRDRSAIQISLPGMVVTGVDDASFAESRGGHPQTAGLLRVHPRLPTGPRAPRLGRPPDELNVLSKRGAWDEMTGLIDDDVLTTFAVVGGLDAIATTIRSRFGGLIDRFNLYAPSGISAERWAEVLAGVRK